MPKASKVALTGLGVALCVASHSASAASTAGWSQADRSAATVREFQTRLMVAALRCRAAGIDVLASYNQFITADRTELTVANDRLKAHFKSANPAGGDRDYDRYTTSLANGSAGEQWSPESCNRAARMAREAAASSGNLLAVAAGTSQVADGSPASWSSPASDDRPAPPLYADRGPPPGYDRDAPSSRDNGGWQSPQAYDDRGPPPGYYDNSPSWRERDDWQSQHAYNDQAPSPYDDRAPPPGYSGY